MMHRRNQMNREQFVRTRLQEEMVLLQRQLGERKLENQQVWLGGFGPDRWLTMAW